MRDDFSEQVKKEIAPRVAYLCSNPSCRAPTKGPHSNKNKSVSVGVAAHIVAASPGGPRYDDKTMTQAERKSVNNGIWLCQTCAKLIDNDPDKFSVSVLYGWKEEAEREASERVGKPVDSINDLKKKELMDKRFQMVINDAWKGNRHSGTPKPMIDTFNDLSPSEKAELYDRAIMWKKGRSSNKNPYK